MSRTAGCMLGFLLLTGSNPAMAQDSRIRLFVTDSDSWSVSGGFGASSNGSGGGVSGGARPQRAEIMKTVGERCLVLTVTIKQENADYILLLDHEGGKEIIRRDNKVAIFNKEGDMIYSGSTRTLGNAVKDACAAIERDLAGRRQGPRQTGLP